MSELRAYTVSFDAIDYTLGVIVMAESRGRAKRLAMQSRGFDDVEFTELLCRREPRADVNPFRQEEGVIERYGDVEFCRWLRGLGWRQAEEWQSCDSCGLYYWEDVPESLVIETEEGAECLECSKPERAGGEG